MARPPPLRQIGCCCLALWALGWPFPAPAATEWSLRSWNLDHGLPHLTVNGLTQAADGFLWIVTPRGAARFDGHAFEEIDYLPRRPSGLGGRAIAVTPGGDLWIATMRGELVRLDRTGKRTVWGESDGLPSWGSDRLSISPNNELSALYSTSVLWEVRGGRPRRVPGGSLPPEVTSAVHASDGRLWLAARGAIGSWDGSHFARLADLPAGIADLGPARKGGMWITHDNRLLHCSAAGVLRDLGAYSASRSHQRASRILEDRRGGVWLGTAAEGLVHFDGHRFSRAPSSHSTITALLEDNEGNIWVGTGGGGLDRLRPRGARLEGTSAGLPVEAVGSVCQDADGILWATTGNGLLMRRDGTAWSRVEFETGAGPAHATCVAADPAGGIYVGTRNGVLFHWQGNKGTSWNKADGLAASSITALLVDRTGKLWIGNNAKVIQCFAGGKFQSFSLPSNARVVRAMAEDTEGRVWFGTSQGLLLRVEGQHLVEDPVATGDSPHPIRCLLPARDGGLWIGYAGSGLGRFTAAGLVRLGTAEGLLDDHVSQLASDGHGWLWLAGDRGISKVREAELAQAVPGQKHQVEPISLGRDQGFPALQASFGVHPSAVRTREGELWFAMRSALAVVDPRRVPEGPRTPVAVLVTWVQIDERTAAFHGPPLEPAGAGRLGAGTPPLSVSPSHHRVVLHFTALHFSAPETTRFRYKLEGYDPAWTETSGDRKAVYSRLPAGTYRFRLQARSNAGPWTEADHAATFRIAPFFWQTWWFHSATLLAFTGGVILAVRYLSFRRLRRRLAEARQQALLEKERARIARDIHDDLGGRLTEIALLSELELLERSTTSSDAARLEQIARSARQGTDALDEIVWAVNPRNDSLSALIPYVGQFCVRFLDSAGISCRLVLPEPLPQHAISAEARHHLFLTIKEALTNIVRHAGATSVSVGFAVTAAGLSVTIADNGRGFDQTAAAAAGSDGLFNMQQRMLEISGSVLVASQPGNGTHIALTIPMDLALSRA